MTGVGTATYTAKRKAKHTSTPEARSLAAGFVKLPPDEFPCIKNPAGMRLFMVDENGVQGHLCTLRNA